MRQRFRSARLNMHLAEVRYSTYLSPCAPFTRCKAVSARRAGAVRVSQLGNQFHSSGRGSTLRVHAQQTFSTQLIRVGQGGNQIFVAGADGHLGARIVQKLLQAGFKVTAGVVDEEQAQSAVNFATTVELLKKQEAQKLSLKEIDLTNVESITAALPKKARLVVVVGDSGGTKGSRIDARGGTRLLQAAQEVDASQYVLVAPTGSGGGGGSFLGAFFGGGGAGGSGSKPSKLEQDIASSGLDFIVIRTGRTDVLEPDFEASNNVAVGAQGSLPQQARITKNQVAEVVSQVIRLADNDVLVEAWAAQEAPAVGVDEVVLQALPEATIENEEEEEEDEKEAGGVAKAAQAVEEAAAPNSPGGLFGSFGTRRVKAGGDASAEVSTPPAAGTKRVSSRSATQQGNEETPRKPAFGFGRKASAVEEEEKEEAPYNPAEALRGIFGSKKKDDVSSAVGPENARKSAARGIKAAGNAVQKASSARGKQRPGADEAKPKKGFLESLGFGGKTTYVNNDD